MASANCTCLICGKAKGARNFYKHRNETLASNVGFCKACVNEIDLSDIELAKDIMRLMNIPFVQEVWESQIANGDTSLGTYSRTIGPKKEYVTFFDSIFEKGTEHELSNDEVDNFRITPQLMKRWGMGLDKEEYWALQASYDSFVNIRKPSTLYEEKQYVQAAKLERLVDKALEEGVTKDIKDLQVTYGKKIKDLSLDIDTSNDEMKRLGERIQTWEREEPIPEIGEEFNDVDGIGKYFNKFVLIPLKRVFGQESIEEEALLNEGIDGGDLDG